MSNILPIMPQSWRQAWSLWYTVKKTNIEKEEQVIDAEDEDFFGDVVDIEMPLTDEKVIEEVVRIYEIIANVRKLVKYFRFSSDQSWATTSS
jgi:hypothetical protein